MSTRKVTPSDASVTKSNEHTGFSKGSFSAADERAVAENILENDRADVRSAMLRIGRRMD